MPLFEFDCPSCGCDMELLLRRDETPACPNCGAAELTKRLSVPASPQGGRAAALPMAGQCSPDRSLPPCNPHCCRLP